MHSRIGQDLRYAARTLSHRPALVLVAALSLGLGAGFNTTVFGLLNTFVLRAPSAENPGRLLRIEPGNSNQISYPNYRELPATDLLTSYGAYSLSRMNLGRDEDLRRVDVMLVSATLFEMLGVRPALGRRFDASNSPERESQVAIVSDRLWRTRYRGNPGVLGETVLLNGHAFTIIGVMPADYRPLISTVDPELYLPIGRLVVPDLHDRRLAYLTLVARLAAGATAAQARAAFTTICSGLESSYPEINKNFSQPAFVAPLSGLGSLQSRAAPQGLYALVGVPFVLVGLVLIIACANVASVLLARGLTRRKEIAIRLALGASRRDLIQTLLAESFLLSSAGAAIGVSLAFWLTALLDRLRLPNLPETLDLRLSFDISLAAYLAGLVLLTTGLCGLVPAIQSARQDLAGALKFGAGEQVRRRLSWRRTLVVGQVAVSALLLAIAFVFVQGLWRIANVAPGFDTASGLVASVGLDPRRYPAGQDRLLAEQLMDQAAQLPGVTAVSVANVVPLAGDSSLIFPRADVAPDREGPEGNLTHVGPAYFATMGIPLVAGREFTLGDRARTAPVAIVNEALVRHLFPDRTPLGRRVRLHSESPWHEIVGVVRNTNYQFLGEEPRPLVYYPYLQEGGRLNLHVRANGSPTALIPAIRAVIARQDSALLAEVRTLQEATSQEFQIRRAGSSVLGLLGGVGLLLVIVGLYGLMAQTVTERTREIGIRRALGADRARILWTVWRDGLQLVVGGLGLGLGIAILATRPFAAVFAGVSADDPITLVSVVGLFLLVTALACVGPARRALTVDPITALRE